MSHVGLLDYAPYFVVWSLVIGYFAYRGWKKTDNLQDLALARGHWGPIVLGFSAAATMASSATVIGIPGIVYGSQGLPGLWAGMATWTGFGLGFVLFAKTFRRIGHRFNSLTVPDWLGHVYGNDAVRVIAALFVIFQTVWIIAQLTGISRLLAGLSPVTYETSLVIAAIIVFSYVIIGGENAVQGSDFFQGLLVAFVVVLAVLAGFWIIEGGIANLPTAIAQAGGDTGVYSSSFPIVSGPLAILGWFVFFVGLAISAPVGKKFLSLESEKDIKLFIGTVIVTQMIWDLSAISGLYAVVAFPGLEAPDQAIIQVIHTAFPATVAAFMAFAILSASVSTVDSTVIALTISYSNDIYRRVLVDRGLVHEGKSAEWVDNFAVWLSRGIIAIVGLASIIISLYPPEFLAIFVGIGNYAFVSAVFAPIVFGMFWDQANAKGALSSMVFAPIIYLYIFLSNTVPNPFVAGLYGLISGVVIMVAVSYVTSGQSELATPEAAEPADD